MAEIVDLAAERAKRRRRDFMVCAFFVGLAAAIIFCRVRRGETPAP